MTSKILHAGFSALLALSFAPAAMAQEAVTERLDDRSNFKSGEDLWNKVCARCHLVEGKASEQSVGPDLSVNEYDADTLKYFIRNGHLAMPAFPESAMSDASVAELADYFAKNVYKGEAQ